ncbi:MAG: hypothetical protein QOJ85_2413, partial [Solirubrobacteraceae bacterium]|nr:hypothetical protein [Solirubrobacteraceae bacterium]
MSATLRPELDVAGDSVHPRRSPSFLDRRSELLWQLALVVLLAGTAVFMFHLARGLTFNLDEWIVVTERRGPGAPSLLEPHNEHLSVVLLSVFLGLLKLGGLDDQPLMMVPLVALQVALGALLFVVARRRVGAGVALGVAALAMVCGLAYENFLIPGQAGQMASIVAGVGAFATLDRPPDRRTNLLLAGLVTVALASSGMGIPVLAGVAVELLLTPAGRRRLWVIGVPFGLYLLWYVGYGTNRAALDQ